MGGGLTGIGQGSVSLSPAATAGTRRAIMAGYRGAAGWVGLQRHF